MNNQQHSPVKINPSLIPLGVVYREAVSGIAQGGLLRWRGADLKSPMVLNGIKDEFKVFSQGINTTNMSMADVWSLFIRQF
ncbi:hypothetical protein [Cellvibrio sp. QJXJ]|uniref:hypothetical protein n=1 Tax=Cellvibrio sp. QJXJ TaxID=2964606 RepID=UPI0021C467CD|nr:hypothetical protein [Cellvibrio sp. QJXJ]UUA75167.1 hypothetical protein NNX04_22175 [Cellvibrio sp. QJXJ]